MKDQEKLCEVADVLVSNALAVKVGETGGHLTGNGNKFPSLSEGSCLPPLADQVGLEAPMGTVLHQDHDGGTIHTHSQQRQYIWVLKTTAFHRERIKGDKGKN